jgi:hypothetical protein
VAPSARLLLLKKLCADAPSSKLLPFFNDGCNLLVSIKAMIQVFAALHRLGMERKTSLNFLFLEKIRMEHLNASFFYINLLCNRVVP